MYDAKSNEANPSLMFNTCARARVCVCVFVCVAVCTCMCVLQQNSYVCLSEIYTSGHDK